MARLGIRLGRRSVLSTRIRIGRRSKRSAFMMLANHPELVSTVGLLTMPPVAKAATRCASSHHAARVAVGIIRVVIIPHATTQGGVTPERSSRARLRKSDLFGPAGAGLAAAATLRPGHGLDAVLAECARELRARGLVEMSSRSGTDNVAQLLRSRELEIGRAQAWPPTAAPGGARSRTARARRSTNEGNFPT